MEFQTYETTDTAKCDRFSWTFCSRSSCAFVVFFGILISTMPLITLSLFCASRGALKYQTNLEAHPPGCLRTNHSSTEQQDEELKQNEDEERRCREEAHFQPHSPQVCLCLCLCVGRQCVLNICSPTFEHISTPVWVEWSARALKCVSDVLSVEMLYLCLSIWEVIEGVGPIY